MTTLTRTAQTGNGNASVGALLTLDAIQVQITSITNNQVRQGLTVGGTTKLSFAGSVGVMVTDGSETDIGYWEPITWTNQLLIPSHVAILTHVMWALRPGVTATIVYTYH